MNLLFIDIIEITLTFAQATFLKSKTKFIVFRYIGHFSIMLES